MTPLARSDGDVEAEHGMTREGDRLIAVVNRLDAGTYTLSAVADLNCWALTLAGPELRVR